MSTIPSNDKYYLNRAVYLPDLIQADKTRKIKIIGSAIKSYLETCPTQDFATIELSLRANHCYTHLYAKDPSPAFKSKFGEETRRFVLHLTTKDPQIAKQEVLKYSGDEQTNLERLRNTGYCFLENMSDLNKMKFGESLELFS